MWDLSHTHTNHTINQIRVSQSPPFKSLTSSLGPTLWDSVFELTRDYRAGSNTICNDPRKNASHICIIPQKDQSQLRFLVVVNKTQIYPVNTRCGTHHTSTHITQSIKLGYHTFKSIFLHDFILFYLLQICFPFQSVMMLNLSNKSYNLITAQQSCMVT